MAGTGTQLSTDQTLYVAKLRREQGLPEDALQGLMTSAEKYLQQHGSLEGWAEAHQTHSAAAQGDAKRQAVRDYHRDVRAARKNLNGALKAEGHVFQRAEYRDILSAMQIILDGLHGTGRTNAMAALREVAKRSHKGEAWVEAVARQSQTQHLKTALKQHEDHPAMKTIRGEDLNERCSPEAKAAAKAAPGAIRDASTGTLSRSARALKKQHNEMQRHQSAEQRRIQELEQWRERAEAQLAALQRRHDIEDAGGSVKDEVLRLRRETGKGHKAIAKLLGVNENNAKYWIREAEKDGRA